MEIPAGLLSALPPLVGVLVGASLQYAFGRTLELRKHLQSQKAQAYADYCRAFSSIATVGRSKEALSQLTDAKTRVCIYGSPSVVRLLGEFEREGAKTDTGERRRLVSNLVAAMRADIGGSGRSPANAEDLGVVLFGSDWRL